MGSILKHLSEKCEIKQKQNYKYYEQHNWNNDIQKIHG